MSIGYLILLIIGVIIYFILQKISGSLFKKEEKLIELSLNQNSIVLNPNFFTIEFLNYFESINVNKLNNGDLESEFRVINYWIEYLEIGVDTQYGISYNLN